MKLVSVMHVICSEQIQAAGMTPQQFAKQLPFPPDQMLTALEGAICNFFPIGRHSHVLAVLASFGNMASRTDALTIAKMEALVSDTRLAKAMSDKADHVISQTIREMIDSPVGTSNTAEEIASS
jgi:hypothetical protein